MFIVRISKFYYTASGIITEGEIGALTGNTYSFRKRVRKVITSEAK